MIETEYNPEENKGTVRVNGYSVCFLDFNTSEFEDFEEMTDDDKNDYWEMMENEKDEYEKEIKEYDNGQYSIYN